MKSRTRGLSAAERAQLRQLRAIEKNKKPQIFKWMREHLTDVAGVYGPLRACPLQRCGGHGWITLQGYGQWFWVPERKAILRLGLRAKLLNDEQLACHADVYEVLHGLLESATQSFNEKLQRFGKMHEQHDLHLLDHLANLLLLQRKYRFPPP